MRYVADTFGCKVGTLPLAYLGFSISLRKTIKSLWDPIIERFEGSFLFWKSKSSVFWCLAYSYRISILLAPTCDMIQSYLSPSGCPASYLMFHQHGKNKICNTTVLNFSFSMGKLELNPLSVSRSILFMMYWVYLYLHLINLLVE